MVSILPLLVIANPALAIDGYRILEVDRHEVFAGRLGMRVEQTLTAERNGKRYVIQLGRAHTAIRGSVRDYAAGDVVKPDWGAIVREK